jgi:hypothetical protein
MSIIVAQLSRLFQENAEDRFLSASLPSFAGSFPVCMFLQGPSFFMRNMINRDKQLVKRPGSSEGFQWENSYSEPDVEIVPVSGVGRNGYKVQDM